MQFWERIRIDRTLEKQSRQAKSVNTSSFLWRMELGGGVVSFPISLGDSFSDQSSSLIYLLGEEEEKGPFPQRTNSRKPTLMQNNLQLMRCPCFGARTRLTLTMKGLSRGRKWRIGNEWKRRREGLFSRWASARSCGERERDGWREDSHATSFPSLHLLWFSLFCIFSLFL